MKNLTPKQEAIKKAYGEHWEIVKSHVDEMGWIDISMENNLENKETFFYVYGKQKVLVRNIIAEEYKELRICTAFEWDGWLSTSHLLLTPLSQITDDDAIEVALLNHNDPNDERVNMVQFGRAIASRNTEFRHGTADYLRSRGYALPYMSLSVEQQIEYGWIKLRE